MFVGRQKELQILNELYESNKFEMLLLHGRRRVGKSYLLANFVSKHPTNKIYFTADKAGEKENVFRFVQEMKKIIHTNDYVDLFEKWYDVFSLIDEKIIDKKLIIIIDEFTYLLYQNPEFDSVLQNAIDRILKNKNILLILCGSEISVIEDLLSNSNKPLYGRKTADLKVEPFTYLEAKEFFPNYSNEDSLIAYSILGGIPLYLSLFDDKKSIKENVIKNCLSTTGYLFNEASNVLKMELKETTYYESILVAINGGSSTFNDITTKVNGEPAKIAKYLKVLCNLGIVQKEVPSGEKPTSRNSLYIIYDNYIAFWFRFVYRHMPMLNGFIAPEAYYEKELNKSNLNTFVGHRFEKVCEQFLKNKAFNGKLPFYPETLGRWWGSNPILKKQEEVDILAQDGENALLCECKFTTTQFDKKELDDLFESSLCFNKKRKHYIIISKSGFTDYVIEKAKEEKMVLITLDDLYNN